MKLRYTVGYLSQHRQEVVEPEISTRDVSSLSSSLFKRIKLWTLKKYKNPKQEENRGTSMLECDTLALSLGATRFLTELFLL